MNFSKTFLDAVSRDVSRHGWTLRYSEDGWKLFKGENTIFLATLIELLYFHGPDAVEVCLVEAESF